MNELLQVKIKGKGARMFNFDNTLISDYAKCPAAAIARHEHKRTSKQEKVAADIGNVFHSCMEAHFKGLGVVRVKEIFEQEYHTVIPVGQIPAEDRFGKVNLLKILDRYCHLLSPDKFPFKCLEFEKTVGVEIEEGFKFWMKRDMLIQENTSGSVLPLDHKTTKKINDWWMRKFEFDSQFSGYIWGTGQITGKPIDRLYVNAIELWTLPTSARKCRLHDMKYSECSALHSNFKTLIYSRTPEQLAAWLRDIKMLAKRAKVHFQAYADVNALQIAPRYGAFNNGCTFCEFQKWCKMNFAPGAMEELTIERTWAPWEEKEGEEEPSGRGEIPAGVLSSEYAWYFSQTANRVWPASEHPGPGAVEISEILAFQTLQRQGQDSWMYVWKTWPEVQERMLAWKRENN